MNAKDQAEYRNRFKDELPIILAAQNDCPEAIEKLVSLTLPVRRVFAYRFFPNNSSMHEDAMQVGWIGTQKALKKWDPKRKVCFTDWCRYHIREAVRDFKCKMEKSVARPHWINRKFNQINNFPTENLQELAELMSCPTYQIEVIQGLRSSDLSLSIGDSGVNDPTLLGHQLVHHLTPSDDLSQSEMISLILARAQSLTERERLIIDSRYGLTKGESITHSEIGESLGLTRQRVEQIESVALGKIRSYIERLDKGAGTITHSTRRTSNRHQKRRNFCRRSKKDGGHRS